MGLIYPVFMTRMKNRLRANSLPDFQRALPDETHAPHHARDARVSEFGQRHRDRLIALGALFAAAAAVVLGAQFVILAVSSVSAIAH